MSRGELERLLRHEEPAPARIDPPAEPKPAPGTSPTRAPRLALRSPQALAQQPKTRIVVGLVNAHTIGLPRYAKQAVDQQFARWVMVQSNPLPICTRPRVLLRGRRT